MRTSTKRTAIRYSIVVGCMLAALSAIGGFVLQTFIPAVAWIATGLAWDRRLARRARERAAEGGPNDVGARG